MLKMHLTYLLVCLPQASSFQAGLITCQCIKKRTIHPRKTQLMFEMSCD